MSLSVVDVYDQPRVPSPQSIDHLVPIKTPVGSNPRGAAWNIPVAPTFTHSPTLPKNVKSWISGQGFVVQSNLIGTACRTPPPSSATI